MSKGYRNKKATVCLCMIIKNEGKIIYESLEKLYEKIKFDFWIICDTGSTDNTIDELKRFFIKTKYRGQLFKTDWVNFAVNRTEALEKARDKTDYVFVFDADDRIEGNLVIPKYQKGNGYTLNFTNGKIFWKRITLLDNRMEWYYEGVVHEYIKTDEPHNRNHLDGNYAIKVNVVTSHRNKIRFNYNKLVEDAKLMEEAFKTEKDIKLKARYAFYCGKNYSGTKNIDKSIEWYKKHLSLNIGKNELWTSSYHLAQIFSNKDKLLSNQYYFRCLNYDPTRFENVYFLLKFYNEEKNIFMIFNLLRMIKYNYTFKNIYNDYLFKNKEIIYDLLPKMIISFFDNIIDLLTEKKCTYEDPSYKYINKREITSIFSELENVFFTSYIVFLNKDDNYYHSQKEGENSTTTNHKTMETDINLPWKKLSFETINQVFHVLKKYILYAKSQNKTENLFKIKPKISIFVDNNKNFIKTNKGLCLTLKEVFGMLPDKNDDSNILGIKTNDADCQTDIQMMNKKNYNIDLATFESMLESNNKKMFQRIEKILSEKQ